MNPARAQSATAASDIPYTLADFEAIARMAHAHAGICLPDSKAMLVYSRLSRLVRASGLASFAGYVELIRHNSAERARVIEALTTNHTKFFREIHHFDHFERELRPAIVERLARGERVRLWSSASSSGEEIYSLAMVLLGTDRDEARQISRGDIALLATDLAQNVLNLAAEGCYPTDSASDIPDRYRDIWTEQRGGQIRMLKPLRDLVRIKQLNLLDPWPIKARFDVIFCRNVLIYFDEATKALLLRRLADQLAPCGYLYIGHSERLVGDCADQFRSMGQTIYRKEL